MTEIKEEVKKISVEDALKKAEANFKDRMNSTEAKTRQPLEFKPKPLALN